MPCASYVTQSCEESKPCHKNGSHGSPGIAADTQWNPMQTGANFHPSTTRAGQEKKKMHAGMTLLQILIPPTIPAAERL